MFTEKDGEEAFKLHNKIVDNEQQRRLLLFETMESIHRLHDTKLYRAILGDEKASWSAYLGQYEVFLSKSQVYTYDRVYKVFVKDLQVNPKILASIPITKLSSLVGIVNGDNVEEWIEKAQTLTNPDFVDEIRKFHGKISRLECSHKNERTYAECEDCGFRHQ